MIKKKLSHDAYLFFSEAGKKGQRIFKKKFSKEQISEIRRKAANTRWSKIKEKKNNEL